MWECDKVKQTICFGTVAKFMGYYGKVYQVS